MHVFCTYVLCCGVLFCFVVLLLLLLLLLLCCVVVYICMVVQVCVFTCVYVYPVVIFRFMQLISEARFRDNDEAAIHILLFISAVIPKALSSLLTSFVYEVAENKVSAFIYPSTCYE